VSASATSQRDFPKSPLHLESVKARFRVRGSDQSKSRSSNSSRGILGPENLYRLHRRKTPREAPDPSRAQAAAQVLEAAPAHECRSPTFVA
jgi:hypothetical protein